MKKILFILFMACALQASMAQPTARRQAQQQAAASQGNANNLTTRAQISFPTTAAMNEDVVWRRDIYREVDLTKDANAGLYYPVEPVGTQMNLFTYLFRLVMRGPNHNGIAAYDYHLDGNEHFEAAARIKPLEFLDKYHIFYERTDRGVHLDDSDIPSAEVKSYYVKESAYYDQATATFHTKVLALCPILTREDDFGDAPTRYPLFWVKYDDLAPFLSKQTIMTSNLNNAATMSIDDYFTKNMYQGQIYKTTNMLGHTLAQACGGDSTKMSAAQKKIEAELKVFEKNMWGDQAAKDSLDSIAKLDKKDVKVSKKKNRRAGGGDTPKVSKRSRRSSGNSSSSSSARVSVRRQRH